MLINGEKYACEACVRGHRVSSCQHSDRKLLHVNKKGRPVSQCQHCRSLRKARSQHIKCECHDKAHAKEDCPHLKENGSAVPDVLPAHSESATNATASAQAIAATAPAQGTAVSSAVEANTCCCGHGARCTCSLKKDHPLDAVPEDYSHLLPAQVEKHKAPHRISSLNNHESKSTIFTNGHHKPVHKINDAHNHCGAPYRVPSRSHTVHGNRSASQRSTDSLPLMKPLAGHTVSPLHSEITSAPRESRKVKSEHGSPELNPVEPAIQGSVGELYIPPLSPTAYGYSPFETHSPLFGSGNGSQSDLPTEALPEELPDHWFFSYDEAQSRHVTPGPTGAADLGSIDWNQYNLNGNNDNNNNTAAATTYTPGSDGSLPLNGQQSTFVPFTDQSSFLPRMSSSGDVSESEEPSSIHRPSALRTVSNASNDLSSPGEERPPHYRLSSASSYMGTPQGNALAGNVENLDIIDDFLKEIDAKQHAAAAAVSVGDRMTSNPFQLQNSMAGPAPTSYPQTSPVLVHPSPGVSTSSQHFDQSSHDSNPSPPYSHSTPEGYIMPKTTSPYGPEHAFTVSEAQIYAHMNAAGGGGVGDPDGNTDIDGLRQASVGGEDPMWSARPDGSSAFKLDDDDDEDAWVR